MLTKAEHKLVEDIANIMNAFVDISGHNEKTHSADMREVCNHIHALQNMVLAQAAARAYPGEYRRIGALCEDDTPTPVYDEIISDVEKHFGPLLTREEWEKKFGAGTRV